LQEKSLKIIKSHGLAAFTPFKKEYLDNLTALWMQSTLFVFEISVYEHNDTEVQPQVTD